MQGSSEVVQQAEERARRRCGVEEEGDGREEPLQGSTRQGWGEGGGGAAGMK